MSEIIINSLKGEVSRQVGLKHWENQCKDYTTIALLKAWKAINNEAVVEQLIWDYITSAPFSYWKSCDSKIFGIYTTIGDYTNKKGETSQVHYTQTGKYMGSVKTLGDKPIPYQGNFQIKKGSAFVIDHTLLPSAKNITDIFIVFKVMDKK